MKLFVKPIIQIKLCAIAILLIIKFNITVPYYTDLYDGVYLYYIGLSFIIYFLIYLIIDKNIIVNYLIFLAVIIIITNLLFKSINMSTLAANGISMSTFYIGFSIINYLTNRLFILLKKY